MNCRDGQGRTPLHEVCCVTEFSNIPKSGTVIELAKKLVANGADPLALDHMGESPLHCVARHRRNREVAAYLVFEVESVYSNSSLIVHQWAMGSKWTIREPWTIREDLLYCNSNIL